MRLTLILLLCVPALSQDENLGNVLWNGAGTLLNIGADLVETGAVAAGAIGVTLWDLGGKGFNSLADNTKNFFTEPTIDESTSDNNVKPVAGGSGSGTTIQPTTEGQNTAEPTVGEGNTVEQTDDLITTKPSLIPLDDSTKPDKPDIKLFVTADQDKCDSTNSNARNSDSSCDQPTPQIIWPKECGDSAIIQDALTQVGVKPGDIRTSEDDCGTYFLTAPMTKEQIGRVLEIATASIKTIVFDDPVTSDGLSRNSIPGRRKKNRRDELMQVTRAPDHLHMISTKYRLDWRGPVNTDYWYLKNAGQSINGYMLLLADVHMQSNNEEFTTENIIKSYDFALVPEEGPVRTNVQLPDPGSALSLVSLVGGQTYGVIKKASLNLIMLSPRTSSFLDGLKKIRNALRNQPRIMNQVLTRTVIMTSIGFESRRITQDPDLENENKAQTLVQELIYRFQVVFLCAAGDIKANIDGTLVKEPYEWPANWVSRSVPIPIIVVGGVDQASGLVAEPSPRFSGLPKYSELLGSVSGDSVTVYAPYYAYADFGEESPRRTGGTACSTAMTMGLAMGLLSQPDVRKDEALNENVEQTSETSTAVKIRDAIVRLAFPRVTGGPKVIWNGADGPQTRFDMTNP